MGKSHLSEKGGLEQKLQKLVGWKGSNVYERMCGERGSISL